MAQKTILLFSLIILTLVAIPLATQPALAQDTQQPNESVEYVIHHTDETNTSEVTISVTLTRQNEYNKWSLTWNIPNDATIKNAQTATSKNITIQQNNQQIELIDSNGPSRKTATFYLTYNTTQQFKINKQNGVTQLEGSLSAIENKPSNITLSIKDHKIINTFRYTNHSVQTGNNTTVLNGTGPISFITNIQTQNATVTTDDYIVYNSNISKTTLNQSYQFSTRILGVIPQIKQIPIIVIDEQPYDEQFGTVSAGQFSKGIIYISKDNIETKKQTLPLLTHEYTHALTERVQPSVAPTWFSEGSAQYTESLARNSINAQQSHLDEGKFWTYTNNQNTWVITNWPDNGENLEFAYTYAEILFKHAEQQNPNTIRTLMQTMTTQETKITQSTTPTVLFNNWTGQVCEKTTKKQTLNCATNALSSTPPNTTPTSYATPFKYDAQQPEPTIKNLEPTINKPTPNTNNTTTPTQKTETKPTSLKQLILDIIKYIRNLL